MRGTGKGGGGRVGGKLDGEGILTVENFILTHAVWVPVTAKADYDETVLFRHLYLRLVSGRRGEVWNRGNTMAWSTCQPVTR